MAGFFKYRAQKMEIATMSLQLIFLCFVELIVKIIINNYNNNSIL